jgi:endoglucanase
MGGGLSHGLARLATAGNRIVRADTGAPVLLRGVNRSGLEYSEPDEQGFLSGAGLVRPEIRTIVEDWGANVIRLPFNQDWVLRGRGGWRPEAYCRALDQVIQWAAGFGAYTILDLQWLQADQPYGGERNFVAPLPNAQSIEMWRTFAARYRGQPAVLFDLFNEPHDRLADDPHPLHRADGTVFPEEQRRVTPAEWRPWARTLIETIRDVNPEALIFVSGIDWGYDLRGMDLALPNVVYSTHVYPSRDANWTEAFGRLAYSVPVFAGEWGCTEDDLDWAWTLMGYFDGLQMGWTAWSWHDAPRLVERYTPTPYGRVVQDALAAGRGIASRMGTIKT